MPEYLAIPEWMSEPCPLDAWVDALVNLGHDPELLPGSAEGLLLRVPELGIEAYAELEDELVTAIDFTLADANQTEALAVLQTVCKSLGWELYAGDEDG